MEQRVLLMVNPMAGRQKIRNELLYVVDTLTKAGYETIIYTTQGKDATRDLLAEKDSQFDRVICCGGDGTFNEILSATMHWDKRPILGYIPAGTTNDFAAGLKLPSDIREAAVNIVRGTPHTVDAGLFNTSYFLMSLLSVLLRRHPIQHRRTLRMHWGIWPIFLRASKRFRHLHPIRSVWKRMDRFIKIPIFSVQSAMPEVWGVF